MKTPKLLITLCVILATFLVSGIGQADDSRVFDSVSSDSALEAPKLTITGTTVSLSWTTVAGATGYTLYYAPAPYTGPASVKNIPMGTQTSMSGSLLDGDAFYVAVQANNSVGSSGYSNIEYINIGNATYGGCTCTGTLYDDRWCDNGNGTVTDLTTCLVWLKDASWGGQYAFWVNRMDGMNAHDRATQLKNGVGGLTDGSVEGDWRLPTKTELDGLVNGTPPLRCKFGPCALYAFTGVQSNYYWSSTTHEFFPYHAWSVYMSLGLVYYATKGTNFYVWPVRSGN